MARKVLIYGQGRSTAKGSARRGGKQMMETEGNEENGCVHGHGNTTPRFFSIRYKYSPGEDWCEIQDYPSPQQWILYVRSTSTLRENPSRSIPHGRPKANLRTQVVMCKQCCTRSIRLLVDPGFLSHEAHDRRLEQVFPQIPPIPSLFICFSQKLPSPTIDPLQSLVFSSKFWCFLGLKMPPFSPLFCGNRNLALRAEPDYFLGALALAHSVRVASAFQ